MTQRKPLKSTGWPLLALVLAMAALGPVSGAQAQNAVCRNLEAQLAKLDSKSTGGSANYQKWDRSVTDQRRALKSTERQARAGNCSIDGRRSFGTPHPKCDQIASTLTRMNANLGKLERRRDRYSGDKGRGAGAQRAIQQKMQRLKCGEPEPRTASRQSIRNFLSGNADDGDTGRSRGNINPSRRQRDPGQSGRTSKRRSGGGLLSLLFGGSSDNRRDDRYDRRGRSAVRFRGRDDLMDGRRHRYRDRLEDDFVDDYSNGRFGGTYRTLCVRQCDGYYFPISFSTTEELFDRDADMCSRLCPSGNPELFIHENPGGTPEGMTSLDGRSYTELPNAFQYRRTFDKNCSCRSAYGKVTTLTRLSVGNGILQVRRFEPAHKVPDLPVPPAKRPIDLDPDAKINLIGRYVPIEPRRDSTPDVPTDRTQTVRIVGPKFFYGQ